MKKIQLTRGKFALVDDEDYDYLNQWKWYFNNKYVARGIRENGRHSTIYMHRVILNPPENRDIDHVNIDPLDNRKCNLRLCTDSQNCANRPLSRNNKSGFKGVCWDKRHSKWRATITYQYKYINIGLFEKPEDAGNAYNKMAIKLFGEFARR